MHILCCISAVIILALPLAQGDPPEATQDAIYNPVALNLAHQTLEPSSDCIGGEYMRGFLKLDSMARNTEVELPTDPTPNNGVDCAIGTWISDSLERDLPINGIMTLNTTLLSKSFTAQVTSFHFTLLVIPEGEVAVGPEIALSGGFEGFALSSGESRAVTLKTEPIDIVVKKGEKLNLMLFYQGYGDVYMMPRDDKHPSVFTIPANSIHLAPTAIPTNDHVNIVADAQSAFSSIDIVETRVEIVGPNGRTYSAKPHENTGENTGVNLSWQWNYGDAPEGKYTVLLRVIDYSGNTWTNTTTFELRHPSVITPANIGGILGGGIALAIAAVYGFRKAIYIIKRRRVLSRVDDIFIVYHDGRLIAHSTRRPVPVADDQLVSAMLTTLKDFVKYSLKEREAAELDELSYGNLKILIEWGCKFFIAAVISGPAPQNMREYMREAITKIEKRYSDTLNDWDGDYGQVGDIRFMAERMLVKDG